MIPDYEDSIEVSLTFQIERQIKRAETDEDFEHDSELDNILAAINNTVDESTVGTTQSQSQIQSQKTNEFPDSQDFNQLINNATNLSGKPSQENVEKDRHQEDVVDVDRQQEEVVEKDGQRQNVKVSKAATEAIEHPDNSMPMVTIYTANGEEISFEPDSVQSSETLDNSDAAQNRETLQNPISPPKVQSSPGSANKLQNSETPKNLRRTARNGSSASSIASSSGTGSQTIVPASFRQLSKASRSSGDLIFF